ncbi:SDR family NAD(P)-dependent oxidoreductase [Tenacibaculum amylolyticum]|uniref:SDR family NAD(P)-dependent oxidoreductase n=1 Tax=Tenacibaculum amylolyticum TaxID=104269 RepID=UPI0038948A57
MSDKKVILITGATDGLGKGVALALAMKGHHLLLHGRDPKRGQVLIADIIKATGNKNLRYYNADFSELAQIKELAIQIIEKEPKLDVLINNAGLGIEPTKRISKEGNEMLWQVNYLGTYMLTKLLQPLLEKSKPARIVQVASAGQAPLLFEDINQNKVWSGMQAYCQSKLAQIMLTIEIGEEFGKSGVIVNALHPASMMPTKIVQHVIDNLSEGVDAVVKLAIDTSLNNVTGKYFFKQLQLKANPTAYSEENRKKLMQLSVEMTGV